MNHALPSLNPTGLYNPEMEHDACGVGFVAQISGIRSKDILDTALRSLRSLMHRGALDADAKTGDGAGVTTQIPHKIFAAEVRKLGHTLYNPTDLGVGVMFLPQGNDYESARAKAITEEVLAKRGLFVFGWREVPINSQVLGEKAQLTMPLIEQVLVGRPAGMGAEDYERRLFLARNEIEDRAAADGIKGFYIPSFSHRTIVYKGLLVSASLEKFYPDLCNPDYETAIALFHQRYSTNTFPTWPLAHPFRMMAHNGEINTIRGNRNWMHAREAELKADFWGADIDLLKPIIQPGGSDSASLDNALEVLAMSGRSLLHAVTMLVPPAYRSDPDLAAEVCAFYEYHRCFCEPWDGPAALVFTDGLTVGACLDRNGLRPARFNITEDGVFVMASEVGGSGLDQLEIIEKGRLAPGEMIAIDTSAGKLLRDADIKNSLATRKPYGQWLAQNLVRIPQLEEASIPEPADALDTLTLTQRQVAFGYSSEEVEMILKPMLRDGAEAVGSMGDDTPLAVLSLKPRLLYTYFKQIFAQVTNPPIDPIREKLVMSLFTVLGWRKNLLSETPEHACLVSIESPILLDAELASLQALGGEHKADTISTLWCLDQGEAGLEPALKRICAEAERSIDSGTRILILSDRGLDHEKIPVPMLLAVGAVHHHLIRVGKRMRAGIVCETGEARDVHHIACLIGYGAAAINPWLAFDTIREILERDHTPRDFAKSALNYRKALEAGLLKIMSKMGISVVNSYRGAQIFEAIGLASPLVADCFHGTPSQIEGIGFREIAAESLARHATAYSETTPVEAGKLADPGYYRFRRGGEVHAITPPVLQSFHAYVGIKGTDKAGKAEDYKKYVDAVLANSPLVLRNLLEMLPMPGGPVPLDEVEPIEDIRCRFTTAGMSLGALSPEAHESLAIAMNRIGGKSNSGEGGEDPERFKRRDNGDWANSAIKQIASGRFGVSAAYLASAKEIEIKMAQGAKPGEGGQLPGSKVSDYIGRLRHSVPGVGLISPPPHHDIYSIEDLAQLIHDLKNVAPHSSISVKLVSEIGVGTIAAGVAKCKSDHVVIAGHDGGTGASPWSSIKHAGSPWEIGLAETQQTLVLNRLRSRIRVQADGQMKTGRDVAIGALLGADEFGFATAPLVVEGCIMMRKCHLNTCPVGVATQDPVLRQKFSGKPEHVVNYFFFIAEEVRHIMAQLGIRKFDDLIGRSDLLDMRKGIEHWKASGLDFSRLFAQPQVPADVPRFQTETQDHGLEKALDNILIAKSRLAIDKGERVQFMEVARNVNRSVGAMLSGAVTMVHPEGLPDDSIRIQLEGTGGQSFGAFLCKGITLYLIGDANDYTGKGLSGGRVVVRPSIDFRGDAVRNTIVGNTVMYGATTGEAFFSGVGGERFAVRLSGATAVIEGTGDHGCEYMTGGTVAVLGKTGRNFAAGMSGGVAYVYDEDGQFASRCNTSMVSLDKVLTAKEQEAQIDKAVWHRGQTDEAQLRKLLEDHNRWTGSKRARELLDQWDSARTKFVKVFPTEYKRALGEIYAKQMAKAEASVAVTKKPAKAVH